METAHSALTFLTWLWALRSPISSVPLVQTGSFQWGRETGNALLRATACAVLSPSSWPVVITVLMARLSSRELQSAPDAIPESGVEPPPLDTAWVEATRKKALLKLEKLDTDLKNYKGNSIKESIRCWPALGRGGGHLGLAGPSTSIHSLPGLQARP